MTTMQEERHGYGKLGHDHEFMYVLKATERLKATGRNESR
jgi:hypothetical protein